MVRACRRNPFLAAAVESASEEHEAFVRRYGERVERCRHELHSIWEEVRAQSRAVDDAEFAELVNAKLNESVWQSPARETKPPPLLEAVRYLGALIDPSGSSGLSLGELHRSVGKLQRHRW